MVAVVAGRRYVYVYLSKGVLSCPSCISRVAVVGIALIVIDDDETSRGESTASGALG